MTKRETLTENMRRLSNIVNEAEQLDEARLLRLVRNFIKMMKKKGREKQVANSTVRQYENIQDLANSLARELGDDPSQWAGKLDNYFAELRQPTVDKIYDRNLDQMSGYSFPSPEQAAHRRMNLVMRQFDEELDQLVKVTAKYAKDPYDVEIKANFSSTATKTAKSVLEKIRRETPAARHLPANHLKALYQELAITKDDQVFPRRVRKYLAGLVAFLAFAVYADVTDLEGRAKADREERLRNNPDIHSRPDPDTDSDLNTTPRRASGSRIYFPDSD